MAPLWLRDCSLTSSPPSASAFIGFHQAITIAHLLPLPACRLTFTSTFTLRESLQRKGSLPQPCPTGHRGTILSTIPPEHPPGSLHLVQWPSTCCHFATVTDRALSVLHQLYASAMMSCSYTAQPSHFIYMYSSTRKRILAMSPSKMPILFVSTNELIAAVP